MRISIENYKRVCWVAFSRFLFDWKAGHTGIYDVQENLSRKLWKKGKSYTLESVFSFRISVLFFQRVNPLSSRVPTINWQKTILYYGSRLTLQTVNESMCLNIFIFIKSFVQVVSFLHGARSQSRTVMKHKITRTIISNTQIISEKKKYCIVFIFFIILWN